MSPCQIIRAASLAGVALKLRGGQLYASLPAEPPAALLATIQAHKPAIIATLHTLATSADLRESTCVRSDIGTLTPAGRAEAGALASDLAWSGGLGQFVCDLVHTWNDLDPADRAAACQAWQLVAAPASEPARVGESQ
jgi:hypothetical protein